MCVAPVFFLEISHFKMENSTLGKEQKDGGEKRWCLVLVERRMIGGLKIELVR